jgi:hypothetical protein
MAFQPMTNDNRAATASQGYDAIARMNMAGTAAIAGGISQAGNAIGGGVSQAIMDMQKRSQQLNANAGTVEALVKSGYLNADDASALVAEKNPDKMSGALMVYLQRAEDQMMMDRQLAVAEAQQKMGAQDQFIPQVVDLGNGMTAVTTSRGGAQVMGGGGAAGRPRVLATENGFVSVDPATGQAIPVTTEDGSPVMPVPKGTGGASGPDRVRELSLLNLDTEIGKVSAEIAKGNKKWGPDWNPMVESYKDQLIRLQAERDALAGGGSGGGAAAGGVAVPAVDGVQAAAVPGAAGGAEKAAALAEAEAAIAAGADPKMVAERLKQMGY